MEKKEERHDAVFVGICGMKHYFGSAMLRPGATVRLVKDPDNPVDDEAIRVEMGTLGRIGYVANSVDTVPRGCYSAGRLYDKIGEEAEGVVWFVLKDAAIVEVRFDGRASPQEPIPS